MMRRAAARRVTLFLSFGVGWGTHSATADPEGNLWEINQPIGSKSEG